MPVGWALRKFWFAYGMIGSFGEKKNRSQMAARQPWGVWYVQQKPVGPPFDGHNQLLSRSNRDNPGQRLSRAQLCIATDQLEWDRLL